MGLSEMMSRSVAARAHVLIAEAPGAFRLRVGVEHAIDAARWCQTDTVADADVLVVIGSPGPELMTLVDHTWEQMSEPRARVHVDDEGGIETGLSTARVTLLASAEQGTIAHQRATGPSAPMAHDEESVHEDAHGDAGHDGHDGHDGQHEDHDHGSMNPDGISLAEGAEDRDGLEMDELHLPLGPVLTHWPAGVVLRVALNGDVVTSATYEQLDPLDLPRSADLAPEHAARLLDSAASLLSLAGLPTHSARTRGLRDRCLTEPSVAHHEVDELATQLGRLRILRWLWRKTTVTDAGGRTIGLHDQLIDMVERAARSLDGDRAPATGRWHSYASLPELVRGQELAAVRLWVAALAADMFPGAEQVAARDQ